MNLINQKLFDFECDAYHDGEFTRVSTEDILGKWSIFFFYPADFSFRVSYGIRGYARALCAFTGIKL